MTKNTKIIGVVGIIKKDNKYLLGLETKESPFKGKWRLLGGKKEEGETTEQTLVREIYEEAKIKIRIVKHLTLITGEYKKIPIHIFLAEWTEGEIKPKEDEHNRIELFTKEEIFALDTDNLTKTLFMQFDTVIADLEVENAK